MEHEKKKRQKKKKNKQGKTSGSSGVGELISENNSHANVANQNQQNLNSDNSDVPNRGLQQTVGDSDKESISGAETAGFDGKNSQFQKESKTWHLKETELQAIILQLQTEKNSWLQKEAAYEEKVNQLVGEASTLRSVRAYFEENHVQMEAEKVNMAQRENSAAETIVSMSKENAKLKAQVIELETSITNISRENQQLKEHVSDLQSKIQDLENSITAPSSSETTKHITEHEEMNSQLESAKALVAKLLSDNDNLAEQVSILKTDLDRKTKNPKEAADTDVTSTTETSETETDPMPSSSAEKLDTVSNTGPTGPLAGPGKGMPLMNHMNLEGFDLNRNSRASMETGEIVQISLSENDVTGATSVTSVPERLEPVPLTDAPLIGAPFRLISFVARYVSGADLVQN